MTPTKKLGEKQRVLLKEESDFTPVKEDLKMLEGSEQRTTIPHQSLVGCKRTLTYDEHDEPLKEEPKPKKANTQENKDSILDITASAKDDQQSEASRQGQGDNLELEEGQEEEMTENDSNEEGKPSKNTDSRSHSYDFYAY